MQLVLMALRPGEEMVKRFTRIVTSSFVWGRESARSGSMAPGRGSRAILPSWFLRARHNVKNTGEKPLKL